MDGESVNKMLRSVLQSTKEGVPIGRLQSDYSSLCGERIPLSRLGYPSLEDYLLSVPSVVRMEHRMGEVRCFAAVCKETRHIAEMVARQKTSKKSGRTQLVNCSMRSKPSNPYMLNERPRSSLRQPSLGGSSGWLSPRPRPYSGHGGFSASGDYRQQDQTGTSLAIHVQHRRATPQTVSRPLPQSFLQAVSRPPPQASLQAVSRPPPQAISRPPPQASLQAVSRPPPQAISRPPPQASLQAVSRPPPQAISRPPPQASLQAVSRPPPQQAYRPSPQVDRKVVQVINHQKPSAGSGTKIRPLGPSSSQPEIYHPELIQSRLSELLSKHCSGLWLSKLPGVYLEMFQQTIPPEALHQMVSWTHICSVENLNSTNRTDRLLYPPLPPPSNRPMLHPSTLPSPNPASPSTSTLPSPNPASPSTSTLPSPNPASPSTSTLPSPNPASPSTSTLPSPNPASPSALPSPNPASPSALSSPNPASPSALPSPKPASPSTNYGALSSPKVSSTSFSSKTSSTSSTMSKQPSDLGPTPVSPGSPLAPPTFLYPPSPTESSQGQTPPSATSLSLRQPSGTPGSAPSAPPAISSASGSVHTSSPAVSTARPTAVPHTDSLPCPANTPPLPPCPPTGSPRIPTAPPHTPAPTASPRTSQRASPLSPELQMRLQELLSKYSQGVWTHALPKLFLDTYKSSFPEAVLAQPALLQDVCSVEYPIPHDRSKAILYESIQAQGKGAELGCPPPPASGVQVLGVRAPPPLALPTAHYPSVLVGDSQGSDRVTIRFVGENYSNAQETMEGAMLAFYTQGPAPKTLSSPAIGQLAAVTGEAGDELARVQVIEFMKSDMVKVYYVDHGFSMAVSSSSLLVLHQDFLALPFQAINVRLAGLEAWSSKPEVLSALDRLAVERILLMETVEASHQGEMMPPLVVLYDTSEDEDLNINAACRKALQDLSLQDHAPFTVNSKFQDVWVTDVSSDGTLSCQLPCRGRLSLSRLLAQIEAFFSSQMTSEWLVSRPFSGMLCLARHRGKWSRAEISILHGSRVMDILFVDLGVSSSVEVTELREVPPPFLHDLTVIPFQALRCVLAGLDRPSGPLRPPALLWIQEAVYDMPCSMKVEEVQQQQRRDGAVVSLFAGSEEQSLNQQLVRSGLLGLLPQEQQNKNQLVLNTGDLSSLVEKLSLNGPPVTPKLNPTQPQTGDSPFKPSPVMPPLVELPQAGQNMDVYVPVACHPGHFVVQPWQDLNKLVVLMGEMVLYYNQSQTSSFTNPPPLHKEHVYAAKVDRSWHRVLLKGVLSTGLVSVYELDYGRYELVNSSQLRPLIPEFRGLPFQAVPAQLAGVPHGGWSEETSMVFRNHVEKRALVAQVESMHEGSGGAEPIGRRLTVFLVDTSEENNDVWIHNIMNDMLDELPPTSTI